MIFKADDKTKRILFKVLFVFVVLAAVKSVFTDTGFDNSYTVAMSYRHLNGDKMFENMWEPHQTSIFFTDILMSVYRIFVPDYTGVMVYLQVCGTIFLGILGLLLYKLLKEYTGETLAVLSGIFFFIYRVKQSPFPEYANLQIGFSVILFYCIVKLLNNEDKWQYTVEAAIALCLECLSYPTAIITFLPVIIYIAAKTSHKIRNAVIFTASCALIGISYIAYFAVSIGFNEFVDNLSNIFYADSHSTDEISAYTYMYGTLIALAWLMLSALIAWVIRLLIKRIRSIETDFLNIFGVILLVIEFVMLVGQKWTGIDWTVSIYILPVFMMLFGSLLGYKKMSVEEKNVWLLGVIISASSFVATAMLTNLGLITILSYTVLGGVVSFIPFKYYGKNIWLFLMAVCAVITIHRGLVVWGYANRYHIYMVYDVEAIIPYGPSAGVVCDYMRYYETICDMEDHPQYVSAEDNLLIVDHYVLDSMEYLLTDANISNHSTIDTPVYNERMLTYYEKYPDKEPSVIAVACWYGTLQVDADSWVMEWINKDYESVGEGRYWRYYRKKK